MRVLWLTQTPAGASELMQYNLPGCGWISSLQDYIKTEPDINLGIAFFHNHDKFKFVDQDVTYYPVHFRNVGLVGKIKQRLTSDLYDTNVPALLKVVEDFKPDVIHLFGTESGMGEIIPLIKTPVVIHLQGLINPYTYAWYPKGVSPRDIWSNSSLKSKLVRTGFYFEHKFFEKRAQREQKIVANGQYFFGRTHWDKNFVKIYSADHEYIHCEEMLRSAFYNSKWVNEPGKTLKLITTVNPYLYKGVEIILETAKLLKQHTALSFEWNVIGVKGDIELVQLVEKLGKARFAENNVKFLGSKNSDEMISLMLNADVFVHPSHIDNSPNSVCEAMLLGMPVIAGNVGGVSTIVKHEQTGILYNSYDPYELSGRLLEFAEDRSKYIEYAKAARRVAIERHNPQRIVETVLSTYHQMTGHTYLQKQAAPDFTV
ncbi:MAG: glycosyltransferase family 4 protein [Flavitalea sp.]